MEDFTIGIGEEKGQKGKTECEGGVLTKIGSRRV